MRRVSLAGFLCLCVGLVPVTAFGLDADGDGFDHPTDCDDSNPSVFPGSTAAEVCDGLASDCGPLVSTTETDQDGDGYVACGPWVGLNAAILGGDDCAWLNADVFPGAAEVCDGLDSDCDGQKLPDEHDDDGDGWLICAPLVGSSPAAGGGDCDPTSDTVYPGAPEVCDGLDSDCDGLTPGDEHDPDWDGFVECGPWLPPSTWSPFVGGDDCDPQDWNTFPGAFEQCDGLDNDCDGVVPPNESTDLDLDGWTECHDCDDTTGDVFPGAPELCDGLDNDCDGLASYGSVPLTDSVAPALASVSIDGLVANQLQVVEPALWDSFSMDVDVPAGVDHFLFIMIAIDNGSGPEWAGFWEGPVLNHGVPTQGLDSGPLGFVLPPSLYLVGVALDGHADVWYEPNPNPFFHGDLVDVLTAFEWSGTYPLPWAIPIVSGPGSYPIDRTYSMAVNGMPESELDQDGDGSVACEDCDDLDPSTFPAAPEVCDQVDNDCDGSVDEGPDADGDGHNQCEDCDDMDPNVYPGATEYCDGFDNDCNGVVDDSTIDADGDGAAECADCDDQDPATNPSAPEACDGVDNNCDGFANFGAVSQSETVGPGTTTVQTDVLNLVTLQEAILLEQFAQEIDASAGVTLDFRIFGYDVQTATAGPLIWSTQTTSPSPVSFPDSGPIQLPLPPGDYLIGVVASQPVTTWYDPSIPASGLATGFGNVAPLTATMASQIFEWSPLGTEDDLDGDTFRLCSAPPDCDDANDLVWPSAPELCDGLDNDCDGTIPLNELDDDQDGFAECAGDCDDSMAQVGPGFPEICDGVDNDCDGLAPDEADGDGDGFSPCDGDCLDTDPSVYPGAAELCDGMDTDCDGTVSAGETDGDGDGWAACQGDCDDFDPATYPSAPEACDQVDNNCNGVAEGGNGPSTDSLLGSIPVTSSGFRGSPYIVQVEALLLDFSVDADVPSPTNVEFQVWQQVGSAWSLVASQPVAAPAGPLPNSGPLDLLLIPGATYLLGLSAEQPVTFYDRPSSFAGENTSFGTTWAWSATVVEAAHPADLTAGTFTWDLGVRAGHEITSLVDGEGDFDGDGAAACTGDCDDLNPAAYQGAPESCDGVDEDCDGVIDDGWDLDADTFLACGFDAQFGTADDDCDDSDPGINPGASEMCDGIDQNCDGLIDEDFDLDFDGVSTCGPDGVAGNSDDDCDDTDPSAFPGSPEWCDGIDTDCDGAFDNGAPDFDGDTTCDAVDDDADGDGATGPFVNGPDCDDLDPSVYPGAPELCDSTDSDCDGLLDDGPGQWPSCLGASVGDLGDLGYGFVVGRVVDELGQAVSGVTVGVAEPSGTDTVDTGGPAGSFSLGVNPSTPEDSWVLEFSAPNHTPAWRRVVVRSGETKAIPPVTLTELSPPVLVSPNPLSETTVPSPDGNYAVVFPAGAIAAPLDVRVTPLYAREQLGSPLPDSSMFTHAVHLSAEAGGFPVTSFSDQLTVKVKNTRNFPLETQIPVGWYDETNHRWVHDSMAVVSEESSGGTQWAYFPTDHFSFFDINFPPDDGPGDGLADPDQGGDEDVDCGHSSVGLYHQFLGEDISLPSFGVQGGRFGLSLAYRSERTRPQAYVRMQLDPGQMTTPPDELEFWAQLAGQEREMVWDSPGNDAVLLKAQIDAVDAATGEYLDTGFADLDWEIGFSYDYVGFGVASSFAAPGINSPGISAINGPETFTRSGTDRTFIVNGRASPFGSGWSLSGLRRLYFDEYSDGTVRKIAMVDGDGTTSHFLRGHGEVIAGSGAASGSAFSSGAPALEADLGVPGGLAVDPVSGNVFFADEGLHCIVRATEGGGGEWTLTQFVGTCGTEASSPAADGAPATSSLSEPGAMAIDPAGSWLYFVEAGYECVRRAPVAGGPIETVAGLCGGQLPGHCQASAGQYPVFESDYLPTVDARCAPLAPSAVLAPDSSGSVLVADDEAAVSGPWMGRVVRVDTQSGFSAQTVVGAPAHHPLWIANLALCAASPFCGLAAMPGVPVRRRVPLREPSSLALLSDGTTGPVSVLVLDRQPGGSAQPVGSVVYEVRLDGDETWNVFAGSGHRWGRAFGGRASDLPMADADAIAADPLTGVAYIAIGARVVEVDAMGRVREFLGTGAPRPSGLPPTAGGGPAARALLRETQGLAVGPLGRLFVTDEIDARLWMADRDVWWTTTPESAASLQENLGTGQWELDLGRGSSQTFDVDGFLISTQDSASPPNVTTFGWSDELLTSITVRNQTTALNYVGGVLDSIVDPMGRQTSFNVVGGELLSVELPQNQTWSFGYTDGLLESKMDPSGSETEYTIDSIGRVAQVTHPDPVTGAAAGPVTSWTPVWSVGLAAPAPYTGAPQPPALLSDEQVLVTDAGPIVHAYRFGGDGRVSEMTDPEGRTTTFDFDPLLRTTTITPSNAGGAQPTEGVTTLTHDLRGRVVEIAYDIGDPSRLIRRRYLHDAFDNVTASWWWAGSGGNWTGAGARDLTEWTYDPSSLLPLTVSVAATNTAYQPPLVTSFAWNPDGTLDYVTDPTSRTTSFTYDPNTGNVETVTAGSLGATTFVYDQFGNRESVIDSEGRVWTTLHDELNRPTDSDAGLGVFRSFGFSGSCPTCPGNLPSEVIDELGNSVSYEYDALNRLESIEWPTLALDPTAGSQRTFTYDAAGRLYQATDRNLTTETWTYTASGAPDSVVLDDGVSGPEAVSWSYNTDGTVQSISDGRSTVSWTYDAAGRVTSESVTGFGDLAALPDSSIGVTFYDHGLVDETTVEIDGQLLVTKSYFYDDYNRLVSVRPDTQPSTNAVDLAWDEAGRLTELHGNASFRNCFAYGSAGELTAVKHGSCTSPDHTVALGRDDAGVVDELSDWFAAGTGLSSVSGPVATDDSLRVVQSWSGGQRIGRALTDFDDVGNRDPSANEFDERHRLLTTPEYVFDYDDAGQLLSKTEPGVSETSYTWDTRGRLTEVHTIDLTGGDDDDSASTVTEVAAYLDYDVLGRLVRSEINGEIRFYVHGGDHIDSMYDENGDLLARYHYGPGADMPVATELANGTWLSHYILHDGSVEMRQSAGTQYPARINYTLDGEPFVVTTEQPDPNEPPETVLTPYDPGVHLLAFQGRPWFPELGLAWFRARWYEPETARFLSEDSEWPYEPNPYGFANSNSIRFRDPSGNSTEVANFIASFSPGPDRVVAVLDSLNSWVALNRCYPAGVATRIWARNQMLDLALGAGFAAIAWRALRVLRNVRRACFVGGTSVLTSRGPIPIEAVAVGDQVLSRDAESGLDTESEVIGTVSTANRRVLRLSLVEADGTTTSVDVTPEHPFWARDRGWIEAGELRPGTELVSADGEVVFVAASEVVEDAATVYNLVVEGTHSYFAGEAEVWVHNGDCWNGEFTSEMGSRAEVIAKGRKIRKVDELVRQYGGRARNWKKKKTWDASGNEIHYYEHPGIGRVGTKWAGEHDPF